MVPFYFAYFKNGGIREWQKSSYTSMEILGEDY